MNNPWYKKFGIGYLWSNKCCINYTSPSEIKLNNIPNMIKLIKGRFLNLKKKDSYSKPTRKLYKGFAK